MTTEPSPTAEPDMIWLENDLPPHQLLASPYFPIEAVETPVKWHLLHCPECSAWGHVQRLTADADWKRWVIKRVVRA